MLEEQTQTNVAPEATSGGTAAAPDSAPAPSGGQASWEAAFSTEDAGASNRDDDRPAERPDEAAVDDPAPADAAGAQESASAGSRDPQPGSRRSTAAENAELKEQVRAVQAELEAEKLAAVDRARVASEAESFADQLIGKPGELAGLLAKEADQGWLDADDHERKLTLIRGARAYQPLLDRARREVGQASQQQLAAAHGQAQQLLDVWAQQFEVAATLGLPGLDEQALRSASDLPAIVKAAHAAGAHSRDDEIADLKGRLEDARGRAFASQPRLAAGGVSGSGRSTHGYDPTISPASNLAAAFDEPARSNGTR